MWPRPTSEILYLRLYDLNRVSKWPLTKPLFRTISHSPRLNPFSSSTRHYANLVSGVNQDVPRDLDLTGTSLQSWLRSPYPETWGVVCQKRTSDGSLLSYPNSFWYRKSSSVKDFVLSWDSIVIGCEGHQPHFSYFRTSPVDPPWGTVTVCLSEGRRSTCDTVPRRVWGRKRRPVGKAVYYSWDTDLITRFHVWDLPLPLGLPGDILVEERGFEVFVSSPTFATHVRRVDPWGFLVVRPTTDPHPYDSLPLWANNCFDQFQPQYLKPLNH